LLARAQSEGLLGWGKADQRLRQGN